MYSTDTTWLLAMRTQLDLSKCTTDIENFSPKIPPRNVIYSHVSANKTKKVTTERRALCPKTQ
uniref:Uncharacterized protein n=1 Tax=Anguilla anguilla TaxID=7936 RepID=A0A0E9WQT7_ANGAN